jgi:hypothetical protein
LEKYLASNYHAATVSNFERIIRSMKAIDIAGIDKVKTPGLQTVL